MNPTRSQGSTTQKERSTADNGARRAAGRVAQLIQNLLPLLAPADRRPFLEQTHKWLGEQLADLDWYAAEQKRKIVTPTPAETQVANGAFGKGSRSSDVT